MTIIIAWKNFQGNIRLLSGKSALSFYLELSLVSALPLSEVVEQTAIAAPVHLFIASAASLTLSHITW